MWGQTFTAGGDRVGSQELWNAKSADSVSSLEVIGSYDSASKTFFMVSPPTWAGGEENMTLPASLLSCASGFALNQGSTQCEPCLPGLGCGYDPDAGFPIGLYAPITSISHEFLAVAILFDMDFRKYTEPALRARFRDKRSSPEKKFLGRKSRGHPGGHP